MNFIKEIYAEMGYGSVQPDEAIRAEVEALMAEVEQIARPRFLFHIVDGVLGEDGKTLTIIKEAGGLSVANPASFHSNTSNQSQETDTQEVRESSSLFSIGRIIHKELRGSTRYALFVATAGTEFHEYQQRLSAEGDMMRVYVADIIGTLLAEHTADQMEDALQRELDMLGWQRTNRFSPGYCGWHVSEQQILFPLFPESNPCGIQLTESSLMIPIKSVSGIIGIGPDVTKHPYTCNLCGYEKCFRRKK